MIPLKKYANVLSPIRVGKLALKSRFVAANSLPHFLQGPETFPSEQVITHLGNIARNGAAIVTFADWTNQKQRESFNEDGKRFPMYDLSDPSVENYISQLADRVHYYGSYISIAIMPFAAPDPMYDVYAVPAVNAVGIDSTNFRDGQVDYNVGVMLRGGAAAREMPKEMIREVIEQAAQTAKYYKTLGFDMVTLHFAYRATLYSRFLSPLTNKRTDEYGGCLENRTRFLLEICTRIKEVCGKDFPIEVQISPEEAGAGYKLPDMIKMAKLCEGLVDIFQFRASNANLNHPTCYNSKLHRYETLDACAAVKASGVKILCEPIGGYQDLDDCEEIIASGKADLIGGARTFFVDPDYYQKAREGRGEDVVPCVRCNKCHVPSLTTNWLSYCTVNPELGLAHALDKITKPAGPKKKVAIVGGGPAGMRAALYAAERGHAVTLYEAGERLGGQLCLMDSPSFKWTLVNYRDWLIRQLEKSQVKIVKNTRATAELLEPENYDILIAAVGAVPAKPPIPGVERARTIFETLGHEAEFGHRVVVIGGSESGTEAGLYLAENGHEVTVLTRQSGLALDATPIHYRETIQEFYAGLPNFGFIPHASATEVGDGWVAYQDAEGREQRIECDSVVALGGMTPLQQEAMSLYPAAKDFYMIGDCRKVGNIHTGSRDAYSVTHQF